MSESEFDYFNRRADEELVAAVKATSVAAAQVHREMSARFRNQANEFRVGSESSQTAEPR
jgi:hypothetical protein